MPRIRTIVPEFWEDERFSNVSLPACLLYIGMKNFADDSGVILANETIIKSKVFPAREDIRKQQVSGWLQELIENSILVPFTFENKSYYVMDFSSERIDKPQKSKIPAEVIENVLSGKNRSNPGTFENIPEQSGTIENPPAGKESKGEDWKGEEGYTRVGTRNPDPEPEKPKNENFEKFKQWIAANAPSVAKLKEPFTEEQFERIKRDFPLQLIQDTLVSMHNYRELLKKYVSANLTFRKWAKRDLKKCSMNQEQAIQLISEIDQTTGVLPPELMPKTRESSVSVWGVLPMPYYNSLRPKTVNDVFDSPSCSIAVMNKEFGETHLRGFMVKVLNDLVDFFNVGKSIGAVQVAQTVDLIIDEYYFFKPDDFKLCFNRAKKGLYGKVYDRIDGAVILEWLGRYEKERGSIAMDDSINNSKSWDIPESDRTSKTLEQAYHEFRKYDFERKYKV